MKTVLGGTALGIIVFFLGMMMMSQSITALAGNKFKKIIQHSTSNPILGILVGMIVTAITQSSSGTTVMVVSLVNSKLMNLYQATYVIMGANIGTTFTGQLVAFNFFSMIPKILFLGVLFHTLNIGPNSRKTGNFLIGFSALFLGIKIMVYFLNPLNEIMGFRELILSVGDNTAKGILLGTITTAIIQSSSTGIAIMQGLAYNGLITVFLAMPIMFGLNIGTCATTLISSLVADKNGKRAAIIHLLFNIIGVMVLLPFMSIFSDFIYSITPTNPVKQISNAHSLFNIINTILLFPFAGLMVSISKKIIR